MNSKHLFFIALLLVLLASCTQLEVDPLEPKVTDDLSPVSLENGVSPLLTPEQLKRFEVAELNELDRFLMNPDDDLDFRNGNVVRIPAGSQAALATAIDEAPAGGTVVLEPGQHFESGTVFVTKKIRISGEKGAVLISNSVPMDVAGYVQAAIHVQGAERVIIRGLDIRSSNPIGGTGIIFEDAPRAIAVGNTISEFQFGIIVEKSDRNWIASNTVNASTGWLTGQIPYSIGIVNMNGKAARLMGNRITGGWVGGFTSDVQGLYIGNETFGNFNGTVACNANSFIFPDGTVRNAERPSAQWLFTGNSSHDNYQVGYLVIDGSHDNDLVGNKAANNPNYDIELVGETQRFGVLLPESHDNRVVAYHNITVKDCSSGNTVIGGIRIDTGTDACY